MVLQSPPLFVCVGKALGSCASSRRTPGEAGSYSTVLSVNACVAVPAELLAVKVIL